MDIRTPGDTGLRSAALAGLAGLAFVVLGLPDGLLGVAWPSMRATFGVPLDALGALLTAFAAGYVTSSFAGGRSMRAFGLGGLLALSCGATGLSLLGYAATTSWWTVVGLALVAGLGAGGIDAGINTYAAMRHGPRFLNVLHACWGVGAATGPAIMTAVLASHRPWQAGYVAVAAAQIATALAFAVTRRVWARSQAGDANHPHAEAAPPIAESLRLPAARLGVLLFVCYTGLELGVGAWAFTLLTEGRGMSATRAGAWTSLYWVGLTCGRLLGAALVAHIGSRLLLRSAMALLVAGLALFAASLAPSWDLAGLVIAGTAAGPIFPTLIAQTPGRLGERHAVNAVGFQIAAAALGQALWPSVLGMLGASLGLEALARGLLGLSLVVLAVNEWAGAARPSA
jgi:fucose permease